MRLPQNPFHQAFVRIRGHAMYSRHNGCLTGSHIVTGPICESLPNTQLTIATTGDYARCLAARTANHRRHSTHRLIGNACMQHTHACQRASQPASRTIAIEHRNQNRDETHPNIFECAIQIDAHDAMHHTSRINYECT